MESHMILTKEMVMQHMKDCAFGARAELNGVFVHLLAGEIETAIKHLDYVQSHLDEIDLAVDKYREQHRNEQ